jgi:hypothetical protein
LSDSPVIVPPAIPTSIHAGADAVQTSSTPVREGLPSTYRMRAEPHYVEALARPRGEDRPAVRPPPHPGVALLPTADDGAPSAPAMGGRVVGVAARALVESVAAFQRAVDTLPTRGRPLGDQAALHLARAEAQRARWLAEAVTVLHTDPLLVLDQVDLGVLLARAGEASRAEQRITGVAPTLILPDVPCPVFGDERLLQSALGGMLHAMTTMIEMAASVDRLTVRMWPRREAASWTLEFWQTVLRLPALAVARFFDPEWVDHPAGPTGAVLLAAARRIAAVQGGSLDLTIIDGGGSRLRFTLPAAG